MGPGPPRITGPYTKYRVYRPVSGPGYHCPHRHHRLFTHLPPAPPAATNGPLRPPSSLLQKEKASISGAAGAASAFSAAFAAAPAAHKRLVFGRKVALTAFCLTASLQLLPSLQ